MIMKDPYHSRALIKALNTARAKHGNTYNYSCNQYETQIFVWSVTSIEPSPEDSIIDVFYVEDFYNDSNSK